MEVNAKQILKALKGADQYKGELKSYWASMSLLPDFDYSNFYASHTGFEEIVMQGDVIGGLKVINLPNASLIEAKAAILSSTCDIALQNERKFATKLLYAPLMNMDAYISELQNARDTEGQVKFNEPSVTTHIELIRNQKIGQIFYFPVGGDIPSEMIMFFDRITAYPNEQIDRTNLDASRQVCLSAYGWHVFISRLSHFYSRMTDDTVQMRFDPAH